MMRKGWVPCLEFDAVRSTHFFLSTSLTVACTDMFVFCASSWGMFTGRTAEFPTIMMGGTGLCGNFQCLVVLMLPKCCTKSRSARRRIPTLTFAAWLSTTSSKLSACHLSFRSPPPPPPKSSLIFCILSSCLFVFTCISFFLSDG